MNVVKEIITTNKKIANFWSNSHGWAPESAANILQSSSLRWQVELSEAMKIWIDKSNITDGELILAWVNLGALLENSMKFFLCVYLEDYSGSMNKMKKYKDEILPDEAMLSQLIMFYKKENLFPKHNNLFEKIRNNRNIIHAFQKKNLDDIEILKICLKEYYDFLQELNSRIPYP